MTILKNARKLSDDDLKQVTGGGIFLSGRIDHVELWDIIGDKTGGLVREVSVDTHVESGIGKAAEWAERLGQSTRQYSWDEVIALRDKDSGKNSGKN